uniref:Uncharacterized protein n=1 Tax=Steinernema glaseri TaxID=37863 RepID=A0A1I7YV85_9BILA
MSAPSEGAVCIPGGRRLFGYLWHCFGATCDVREGASSGQHLDVLSVEGEEDGRQSSDVDTILGGLSFRFVAYLNTSR